MTPTVPAQARAPAQTEGVTLADRLAIVTRIARRLFRVPVVLLSLVHERAPRLFTAQGVPATAIGTEVAFDAATLASAGPLVVPDLAADPRFKEHAWVTGRLQLRFYAGTLLVGPDGTVAGTLSVCDRAPNALAEGDLLLLRELARLAESELTLAAHGQAPAERSRDQQRTKAMVDTRTQLWNRHAMFEVLDREFHRAKNEQEAVAVILGEIDRFDAIVKQHGVAAGDAVLREVTNRIRGVVRRSDTVSRFGPDEFLVFLGRCGLESGATLAERMRQGMKSPITVGNRQVPITMTFGVSASEGAAEWTPDALVRRADEALADAVRGGRDKVAAKRL
jgi:diguanylate cyclase (GGDEF)-like protein